MFKKNCLFILLCFLTITHTQAQLLITEVLYDTPGTDSQEEWIEVYNSGCDSINLNHYSLSDNSSTFYLSGYIGAGEYKTIARSQSGFQSLYGFSADIVGLTLSLGNSGDWISLQESGSQIDLVAWENKVSGWNISARHISIYRDGSQDSNTVNDWKVSNNDSPGSGNHTSNCNGSGNPGGSDDGEINQPNYYQDAIGLTGTNLKSALQIIISNGHSKLSYSETWSALQYSDEDPNNTNNVLLVYTGRSHDKEDRVGQSGYDNQSWNREHVWAKSLGFPNQSQFGYTDLHNLKPSDQTVNSSRGNKDFDEGGSTQGEAPDTFTDSNSWEPRDQVKGDIARIIFYMDTRYNGSDSNMPDLSIVHHTNTSTGDPEIGVLCKLYEWHQLDPVDAFEQRRNNRIEALQGNRNPFIDNPQWVESIWQNQCN